MIEVDTATALLIYLGFFLFLCLGMWVFTHLKNRNKVTLPPLYILSTCEYCHFDYLGKNGEKISKCPQCGSFNDRDDHHTRARGNRQSSA